jgi:hypothetical protein
MQQKSSNCNQRANELKQRQENRTSSLCNSDHGVTRVPKKIKYYKREGKADAKHRIKKSKDGAKTTGCISDDTKCLVHPNATHMWGKCYSNAANKKPKLQDKDKKGQGKHHKNEVDANAAHLGDDEVTIDSAGISCGDTDSLSTSLTPRRQKAVNDDATISTVTNGMFAQLCLDLNAKVDDPAALLAKFKAARAVETASEANGTYLYDAFTCTTTDHLHDLSFHALQEINTTVYNRYCRIICST